MLITLFTGPSTGDITKKYMRYIPIFLFVLSVSGLGQARGADVRFERDVRPILNRYCFQCHGEALKMGQLDLRTPESMVKGGSKGPAVAVGSAEESLFYQRILDGSMPLGPTKVPEAEARMIRDWINGGALTSESDEPLVRSSEESLHWAFRLPKRPEIPTVQNADWVRTPVDAFILCRLEEKGLRGAPAADHDTLLRRVYLNLIGLPPTVEEQRAFREDKSSDAYERIVDGLLARSDYGERWARHWLDVVRYAESNGYERDGTKPHAWRYRDYVIDAFNRDKPYDRFIMEQLAGDELDSSNAETQIATTFLRLGTWDDEPAEPLRDRYDQLDDVLGVTATSLLGLTLQCARCHDHKFEPFSQKDYYRMLAVFEPLNRPQDKRTDLDRLVGTEEELEVYRKSKEKADSEVATIEQQSEIMRKKVLKRIFARKDEKSGEDLGWLEHAETVLAFQVKPESRTEEQKKLVEKFNARLDEAIQTEATAQERGQFNGWEKKIAEIDDARLQEPPRAYIWYEEGPEAPSTHILKRGDPTARGEPVQPGLPAVLVRGERDPPQPTRKSAGRRFWLAQWMASPENPLVARVAVNRIWQWNFGEGLVGSENNFGVKGEGPTHPELLDYLATEFIHSGWSIKHIQRLIVKSNTFRMSSSWDRRSAKIDPDERLRWRWKPRRLEAEAVRDSMLASSGRLNRDMGGPSIYPELPRAVLEGQSKPGDGWGESDEQASARRSIYIFSKRSLAVPELEVLDAPDTTASCEQRLVSTTGPQALTFLNGDFTHRQAGYLAARLERAMGNDVRGQISRAFQLTLGRPSRARETKLGLQFLAAQRRQIEADVRASEQEPPDARRKALEAFCLVLLNTNEFFYLN